MQALILAAGKGSRLADAADNRPKCLVEFDGRTILGRLVAALLANGIDTIGVVVGYRAEEIVAFCKTNFPEISFRFIENAEYETTNNIESVHKALDFMKQDDTFLFESDILLKDHLFRDIIGHDQENFSVVGKYQPWMDGGVVRLNGDGDIFEHLEKGRIELEHLESYYKTVNVYRLSRVFCERYFISCLEACRRKLGTSVFYETAFAMMCAEPESRLKSFIADNRDWFEVDDPVDFAQANSLFGAERESGAALHRRYGGYWRFPWLTDASYTVNPYFPSDRMAGELAAVFKDVMRHYPSGHAEQARLAALCFGGEADDLAVGNGASELIASLAPALDGPVAVPVPAFEEYRQRLGDARCTDVTYPLGNMATLAERILSVVKDDRCKGALLINPDNPTGACLPLSDIERLATGLRKSGCRLILDESYVDFADDGFVPSALDTAFLSKHPNLIVIKSISKSYGIAGLRLGVLASADREIVETVRNSNAIWNIGAAAEYFMHLFRKYRGDYASALELIRKERASLFDALSDLNMVEPFPSQANFIFCRLANGLTSQALSAHLLANENILIKDCAGKPGMEDGQYVRLAVNRRDDNLRLIEALRTFEKQWSDDKGSGKS